MRLENEKLSEFFEDHPAANEISREVSARGLMPAGLFFLFFTLVCVLLFASLMLVFHFFVEPVNEWFFDPKQEEW
ncbi:MAG: hypothetical protein NUW37_14825 [Planctomycetes bacterium]|nr:hypothetical protein [Planctomycetota bacterium]